MKTIKNKKIIIISVIVIVLILLTGIFAILKKSFVNGMSKYEWVEMLSTQFNMTEYKNSTPYYVDVTAENDYFAAVQSAYEWKVLEDADSFDGDKKITGEYAALTAMRAIGAYKVKIYLGLSELPTDDDYLNLAITESLINKKELKQNISEERAREILETANNLYMSKLWVDDYVDVTYADDVKELEDDAVIFHNADNSALKLTESALKDLSIGNVIVFLDEASGERKAGRITGIQDDNVTLSDVLLSEIVEKMVISDIMTSSDILFDKWLESIDGDDGLTGTSNYDYRLKPVLNKEFENEGVNITVKFSDKEAEIKFTNNNNGKSISQKIQGNFVTATKKPKIEADNEMYTEVSLEITDINVALQCDYSAFSVNYFDVQLESDLSYKYKQGNKLEARIPLGSFPIVGVKQLAGAMIDLNLVLSLDGSVNLVADLPMEIATEYRKGSGTKVMKYFNPVAEAEVCCDGELVLRLSPTITLIGEDLTDIELNAGIGARSKYTKRSNAMVTDCYDISLFLPIAQIKVGLNEATIGKYLEAVSTFEKEIYGEDNALIKLSFHYEKYKNGTGKYVKECTYNGDDYVSYVDTSDKQNHLAMLKSPFVKVKDHYEANCSLYAQANITKEDLEKLSTGQTYNYYDTSFTVTDMGEFESKSDSSIKKWYIFNDKYVVNTGYGYVQIGDTVFYNISVKKEDLKEWETPYGIEIVYVEVANDFVLYTVDREIGDLTEYKTGDGLSLHFSNGSYIASDEGKLDGVFPAYTPIDTIKVVK